LLMLALLAAVSTTQMSCEGGSSSAVTSGKTSTGAPSTPIFFRPCATTADGLCGPSALTIDAIGNLYVADTDNSRVLEYEMQLAPGGGTPGAPGSPGDTTADVVFGQGGDFTTSQCADGAGSDPAPSAGGLCRPSGVALDASGNLYLVDNGNNRVLGFAALSQPTRAAAHWR
jgi:sugar lactone lactonase YvrE